ncbi:hypothetical protein HBA55_28005 [Pseudomaricurvus alkylphenolicus]|uniref:hypothetical protein n=1 Tax=Pseudomaricurvus alkylphenolicus TaxID=1306991 RepID=UPI00141E8B08|nr:hypothetical protein [Pseudomaricurvus alkylphenolicus]NIB43485.1 hypothetical protein [Pseudomaricurvus alkylphenolicus]
MPSTKASPIDWHYARPELAQTYLTSVTQGIMTRMALLGVRRVGKTEFLLRDFCPVALDNGYLPIYMNLWSEPEQPHLTVLQALQSTLAAEGTDKIKQVLSTEVRKLELGNSLLGKVGMEFAGSAEKASSQELLTIGTCIAELVEAPKLTPVLVIDEVQHLAENEAFLPLQSALRTAFDTAGRELAVVYAGSSRNGIRAMFSDSNKPFYNSAYMAEFPVLGREFTDHCCQILRERFNLHYDPLEVYDVFRQRFDDSPFWMTKLIQHLLVHQCSVQEAVEVVRDQLALDGDFMGIAKALNKTDKTILLLIKARAGKLYSDQTQADVKARFGLTLTASKINASLKKLQRHQLITKSGRSDYLIENAGFADFLQEEVNL